jgi:hypothetical protein
MVRLTISSFKFLVSIAVALLIVLALPSVAEAGNGTYKDGKFSFCVSIRFKADDSQLRVISDAFQRASDVLADATDGQLRFGNISIVNAEIINGEIVPGASNAADVWINPGKGRAYTYLGVYGSRGRHINLYYDSDFSLVDNSDDPAYTIAHEFGHAALGLGDEYESRFGFDAECADPSLEDPTLSFCLMDGFDKRGGGGDGLGFNWTLNEFCIKANHDPDRDTDQSSVNSNKSCWETIATDTKWAAKVPAGLPEDSPPPSQPVNFMIGSGELHVILVVDRSGSMLSSERMEFAKRSARMFINRLNIGDSVGVIDFDEKITVTFPLTRISNESVKAAAIRAIEGLKPRGSTDIGDSLLAALGQLTSQSQRSCNEIIVLLTDGDHNEGTDPISVIPKIQEQRVSTLTVGLGTSLSVSGERILSTIAKETGGRFFRAGSSFELLGLSFFLTVETTGWWGLLGHAPEKISSGQTKEKDLLVESGARSATFALSIADSKDTLIMSLRSPSGITISETTNSPNIKFFAEPNSKRFDVNSPEAGIWKIIATAGAITNGQIELLALAENDGTQLTVSARNGTVTFPEEVQIEASLTSGGFNVVGAAVSGTVNLPDGTKRNISLFDDGKPEHADMKASDGIYSTQFSDYTKDGTYTFELTANAGTTATTFAGESLFADAPPNTKPVSSFTRSASASIVVSGVRSTFGLSVSPGSQSVTGGSSISFNIDVLSFVGFVQPVSLSAALSPSNSNIGLNLTSTTVVPGNRSTLNVSTTKFATPGTYTITIQGTSGQITNSVRVTFDLLRGPTFTITSLTPSQTQAGVVPKKIIVRGSDIPAGSAVFFDSTPVTPKKLAATKAVAKTLPASLFQTDRIINVRLVDPNGFFSNTLTLTVGTGIPPSVSLSATPASQSISPGQSTLFNVVIDRRNFTGNVGLSISGLPSGATAVFSPQNTTGNSSVLTISTTSSVTSGTFPLSLSGTAPGLTIAPFALTLTVQQAGSVRLSAAPAQNTVAAGQKAVYAVTIDRTNFSGAVNLSVSGLPSNTTSMFAPASTTGNSSTLTITTTMATPIGGYTLTIEGTASGVTVSRASVMLVVNATAQPTVRFSVTPASQTVTAGQSADYTVMLDRISFTGLVDVSVGVRTAQVPAGMNARFSQDPVTGNTTVLTLSTTSATPAGTYTLFIRGTATGATVSDSADFTFTVVSSQSGVTLSVSPGTKTIMVGQSADYTITLNRGNFSGPVTLSLLIRAAAVPTGLSARISQNPVTGSSTVLTLSTTGAVPRGTYTFFIRGSAFGSAVADSPDFVLIVQ